MENRVRVVIEIPRIEIEHLVNGIEIFITVIAALTT